MLLCEGYNVKDTMCSLLCAAMLLHPKEGSGVAGA